jgi:L-ascorbate metabolism protein UlaG (beta-lactamase superfamily)
LAGGARRAPLSFVREADGEPRRTVPDLTGRNGAGDVMVGRSLRLLVAVAGTVVTLTGSVLAQGAAPTPPKPDVKPEMMENCPGLVALRPPFIRPASVRLAALARDQMRISYIGHSTFLLESPQLVRVATDYNDYVRPPLLPDIVTMNHAHSTHFTDRPDPGIKHVLRGWAGDERPARVDVQYKDMRVRNVPTNIRRWDGGGTERHGNSIFIFETATLCVAHLGHLHHTLTQQQLNEIGRVDVVFVPVDGSYTLDLEGMVEVLKALKAPLMIPMHYFSAYTLDRFLARVRQDWDVEVAEVPAVVVSKASLPAKPKVLVLPGR